MHLDFEIYVEKTNLEKSAGEADRYKIFKKILTYKSK